MEHLQQLIQDLSKSEKKMVRKFLATYSSNGKSETISLQLFDILNKKKKVLTNKVCSEILFGKDEKNRIRVLKSRLKNKIFDALITDTIINNIDIDDNSKKSIFLKKKLTQCHLLYFSKKGSTTIISSYLNEIIGKASEYELYSILIEAYHFKKLFEGFRKGINYYNELEILHNDAIKQYSSFTSIVNDYYKVLLKYRASVSKKEIISFLNTAIINGNKNIEITASKNSEYYLNIIKYALHIEGQNFAMANEVMRNQLELLNSSNAVYRESRVGATYDYLCQTNIKLHNYSQAANYAQKGKECFKKGELNYSVAEELEFRSYLYDEKLSDAEEIIKNIIRVYKDKLDNHRLSTHKFFLANVYFAKKEYSKCKRLLIEDYDFKKDRTGWEFNLRLLYIMSLIEQSKDEEAYEKYYNLNRLIIKYKDNGESLNSRNQLILEILKKWLAYGGNKVLANMKNSSLIKKIQLEKNSWDQLGSELIPFDKWINTKI